MGLMGDLMGDSDDPEMMETIKPMIQGVKVGMGVDMTIRIDNDAAQKTATATIKSAKATMTFSGDNAQVILGVIEMLLAPPTLSTPSPFPPLELPEGIVLNENKLIIELTNLSLLELSGAGYDNKEATAAIFLRISR
jgi:hypothetical protein